MFNIKTSKFPMSPQKQINRKIERPIGVIGERHRRKVWGESYEKGTEGVE